MSRESEASRLSVEITVTEAGFLIRCAGEISREGVERATEKLVDHPDHDPSASTIRDFRDAVSPGLTGCRVFRDLEAARRSGFGEQSE